MQGAPGERRHNAGTHQNKEAQDPHAIPAGQSHSTHMIYYFDRKITDIIPMINRTLRIRSNLPI